MRVLLRQLGARGLVGRAIGRASGGDGKPKKKRRGGKKTTRVATDQPGRTLLHGIAHESLSASPMTRRIVAATRARAYFLAL
jgi:hypothetical protein